MGKRYPSLVLDDIRNTIAAGLILEQ